MTSDLFAWGTGGYLPVKILAVIGSAALGAFAVGWVVQLAALSFGQKVPRYPLWGLRVLGGLAVGWLVVKLWLFAGGGDGLGGPGGSKIGPGEGKDDAQKAGEVVKKDKSDAESPQPVADLMRIEILSDEPLKKLARSGNFDAARRYRLFGERELRTLDEIKGLIRQRKSSLARLEIILYLDSPHPTGLTVTELERWARDLPDGGKARLKVDFSKRDRYAPLE